MKTKVNLAIIFTLISALFVAVGFYFVTHFGGEAVYDDFAITILSWLAFFVAFIFLSFFQTHKKKNMTTIFIVGGITIAAFCVCFQFLPFIPMEPRTPFEH